MTTKKMNILMMNMPYVGLELGTKEASADVRHWAYPPLGLICLTSKLIDMDYIGKVEFLDFSLFEYSSCESVDDYNAYISQKILRYKSLHPDIVCVSLMYSCSYSFFRVAVECVKSIFSQCILVCGGVHATSTADIILKNDSAVDYVICGEGDIALPKLIEKIHQGNVSDIQGAHCRENVRYKPGTKTLEPAPVAQEIDLNLQVYDYFDAGSYTDLVDILNLSGKPTDGVKSYALMTSRGCPVRCTFCAGHTVHGGAVRWRNLNNIKNEIKLLYERYGITRFILTDENFVPENKTIELLNMLAELPIPNADFVMASMSVNHTTTDILDAMVKANIDNITLAIESGSKEIQKRINKHCNLDKAIQLVDYSKSVGLNTRCFYMLGFPGETIAQMQETIDFSIKVDSDWADFYVAQPFPGTKMYAEFVGMGVIEDSPKQWIINTYRNRQFDVSEITANDLIEMAYRANLEYNFVNNRFIRNGKYAEAERLFTNFLKAFDFHIFAYDCLRRIYIETNREEEADKTIKKMATLLKTNPSSKEFAKYLHMLDRNVSDCLRTVC